MTWTLDEAREELARESFGYDVEMICPVCDTVRPVLHDDRTEEAWSRSELVCDECGYEGMVEL